MGGVLDAYELRARLKPALIVVLPVSMTALAWFPEPVLGWGFLASALSALGFTALLARLARDVGKSKEDVLRFAWGGMPTTIALRIRHSWIDRQTLARWRQNLTSLVPDMKLPSEEEEQQKPKAADEAYETCCRYLREVTRDKTRFPLVFAENVNYGFRRNLWGMKPAGLILSVVGFFCCVAAIFAPAAGWDTSLGISLAGSAVNATLLVLWFLRISPAWVRVAADAYAERLLGASEILG
jgi:hypothetical protein